MTKFVGVRYFILTRRAGAIHYTRMYSMPLSLSGLVEVRTHFLYNGVKAELRRARLRTGKRGRFHA